MSANLRNYSLVLLGYLFLNLCFLESSGSTQEELSHSIIINSFGDTIISGRAIPLSDSTFKISSKDIEYKQVNPSYSSLELQQTQVDLSKLEHIDFKPNNVKTVVIDDTVIQQEGLDYVAKGKIKNYTEYKNTPLELYETRENAISDIEFLDIETGLSSSCVRSIMEDSHGNIWLGTKGGVNINTGNELVVFNTANGFISNRVNDIIEDNSGIYWIATDIGICKYDGKSITYFTEKDGLSHAFILDIFEDSNGTIWFGTNGGGLIKYDGKSFVNYTPEMGLSNVVRNIFEDSKGNIWLSSYTNGVLKYDGEIFTHYDASTGLGSNDIMPVFEDSEGRIWFGTWDAGISIFDGENFSRLTKADGLCDDRINDIKADSEGNIWIGTWEGLSKFDGETIINYKEENGLSDNDILKIYCDNSGKIWLGTYQGGVNSINPNGFSNFINPIHHNSNNILSLLEDRRNTLWFGTWNGISKFNGTTFKNYVSDEFSFHYGHSLLEDSEGNIWIGGDNGILAKFTNELFVSFKIHEVVDNRINDLVEDDSGKIWIATQQSGLYSCDEDNITVYSVGKDVIANDIRDLEIDKQGNIWLATRGTGVAKIESGNITYFTEKEGLSSNNVICVLIDSHENIWFGTEDKGISFYDGKHFNNDLIPDIFSGNSIQGLLENKEGDIWVTTTNGVYLLKNNNKNDSFQLIDSYKFNTNDGLSSSSFNERSLIIDNKNRLWLGSIRGVNMLPVSNIVPENETLRLTLTGVETNETIVNYFNLPDEFNKIIKYDSVVPLYNYPVNPIFTYKLDHIKFKFSVIAHQVTPDVKYSYRIKELNTQWSNPSNETFAEYRNLPRGINTFQVRAQRKGKSWSDPVEYIFKVKPPFWLTYWAIVVYALLLFSLISLYVQWRTQRHRKRQTELEGINAELNLAKDQAEESSKLKSAFMLNLSHEIRTPMNGIMGFTELLKQPELTNETIKSYIELIQKSGTRLINTVTDLVEISTIQTKQTSLKMERIDPIKLLSRVCENFQADIEDKGIEFAYPSDHKDDVFISTDSSKLETVFKHIIRNALKYTEEGKISVGFKIEQDKNNGKIKFWIEDTGIGIPENKLNKIFDPFVQADVEDRDALQGSGLGLAIVKEYVQLLGGELELESKEGIGSRFTVVLPGNPEVIYQSDSSLKPNEKTQDVEDPIEILIAEDDELSIDYLIIILKKFPVKIHVAKNGIEAIEKCKSNPNIKIILMDLKMPDMNGFEATAKIRQFNRDILIVAQTAYAMVGDREKAIKAGCDDYLTKPLKREIFVQKMTRYLRILQE